MVPAMNARMRFTLAVLFTSAVPIVASADAPAPTTAQCYDAHEAGQIQRKRGRIHDARVSFATCDRSVCPPIVQRDCVAWAAELAAAQPSVVVAVVREDGTDVLGARVLVDGAPAPVDGHALELDPGAHTVRVERVGEAPFEERFAVREGDRARRVPIVLREPATSPAARKPPLATYVLGTAAILALGSFGTFAYLGKSRENELSASCGDRCSDDAVAEVRRSYLAADISLGAAVVAAGAAVVVWVTSSKNAAPAVRSERAAR